MIYSCSYFSKVGSSYVPSCADPDHLPTSSPSDSGFRILVPKVSPRATACRPVDAQLMFPTAADRALLTSELETIFAEAPLAPNALAHPHVREAFARATGKQAASSTDVGGPKKRVPGPEDDCPICYDGMHGVAGNKLAYCDACGNAVHKECFQNCASPLSIPKTAWGSLPFVTLALTVQHTVVS